MVWEAAECHKVYYFSEEPSTYNIPSIKDRKKNHRNISKTSLDYKTSLASNYDNIHRKIVKASNYDNILRL
jgi:hypothetical protein